MLSYFGTDQSQVQRYLSGKSVKEMRLGLIFNGLLKVPMQFFILLVGVMVFVFYQFNDAPINFNPTATEEAIYQYPMTISQRGEDSLGSTDKVVNKIDYKRFIKYEVKDG